MALTILALLAEPGTARACLEGALAAARPLGEAVTIRALHVLVDLVHAVTTGEEVPLEQLLHREIGTPDERAGATHAAFAVWLSGLPDGGPRIDWKQVTGAEEEVVAAEAKDALLLVLAKPQIREGQEAFHAAIFRCSAPLLLVPRDFQPVPAIGRHMAIAWNDTQPARRAVKGALPWLRAADRVTALLIAEKPELAASLRQLLAPNQIRAFPWVVARRKNALGAQIIDEAHEAGADLVVMGAYRHGEFLEWALGGTTRNALKRADLPLMLAH
jgi:nucleotide-binding universal stress UspA family protein